jgi:hypothetical protein
MDPQAIIPFLTLLGGFLGFVTFGLNMYDRWRKSAQERRQGALGVSAHFDSMDRTMVVRNDGPQPLVLGTARFIASPRVATPVDVYDYAALNFRPIHLEGSRFLRPGGELVYDVEPSLPPGPGQSDMFHTLVVSFVDHYGRAWEVCGAELVEIPRYRPQSLRYRRWAFLERFGWMRPIELTIHRWAILATARHPKRPSLWAVFLHWLYGWRVGTLDRGFPLGQPRSWFYGDLVLGTREPHLSQMRAWRPFHEWKVEMEEAEARKALELEAMATDAPGPTRAPETDDSPPPEPVRARLRSSDG